MLLVLKHRPDDALLGPFTWLGLFPACLCKQIVNVAQLCSAATQVARRDAEARAKREG